MIEIEVLMPIKASQLYEFRYRVRGLKLNRDRILHRFKSRIRGYGKLFSHIIRFGFVTENYSIQHHFIWDSIYPLLYLTRQGGPLFCSSFENAKIVFHYPVYRQALQFFIKRAFNLGIAITIDCDTYEKKETFDTYGYALSLGGGKESRLALGVFRELKKHLEVFSAGAEHASDIEDVKIHKTFSGRNTDRIFPAIMSGCSCHLYGGDVSGLNRVNPWHRYYDLEGPEPRREMSRFFRDVGMNTVFQSPGCVLPSNLIQKILNSRYPELAKHQKSVRANEKTEKNLHVSLIKMYHGIDFRSHCSENLFIKLLNGFVKHHIDYSEDFGIRQDREWLNREMRSIIYRLKSNTLFSGVRQCIPNEWDTDWIDYIHSYVDPEFPEEILSIYRKYAPEITDINSDLAVFK